MTDQEEKERRVSIQAIMMDSNLSPLERRKSIQSLMDGRRRSSMRQSNGESKRNSLDSSMAIAAAYEGKIVGQTQSGVAAEPRE